MARSGGLPHRELTDRGSVSNNQRYDHLLSALRELHNAKSHDYAQDGNPYSNFEYAAFVAKRFTDPIDVVFATMLGIKLARLAELTSAGKTPRNEALQDTRRDLANYALIWASYTEPQPATADRLLREIIEESRCTQA